MTAVPLHFGTDGWRGLIGEDFTFPNLRRVAEAAAAALLPSTHSLGNSVLIGFDRRFLSPEFAACVADVFKAKGYKVAVAGHPMPTPALSVCVAQRQAAWGFMITASHNPALYNGFKVKDHFGRSAPQEITESIEVAIPDEATMTSGKPAESGGHFDFVPSYMAYLRRRLDGRLLRQMTGTVVFDHLYGVAAGLPERFLRSSKLKMISLHTTNDPLFGGLHPEPIEPYINTLKSEVRRGKALVGIALDGDADRLGVVDDLGRTLTPHQVFPLLLLHCLEHKKWRGKVVQAISLGVLGERIAKQFGLPFEEVPVGFKHVAERMLKEDVVAGGEESGGYAFHGGLPERDGILNGLMFLEMLAVRGLKPSQLLAELEKRFGAARFRRVDVVLAKPVDKSEFVKLMAARVPDRLLGVAVLEVRTFDGVKIMREDGSWVLLRPSGTEPLLRTYAESASWKETAALLHWAQHSVAQH